MFPRVEISEKIHNLYCAPFLLRRNESHGIRFVYFCMGQAHFTGRMTVYEQRKWYVGHLESKERLRIQPAQLFNLS